MLRQITRAEVIKLITTLDKRTESFDDDDFNYVMDMGYAELGTVAHPFENEEVVPMSTYYDAGELKLTLDIEDDVAYVYDLYLTVEGLTDVTTYTNGIMKLRDENYIWKDSRQIGRVHVDLNNVNYDRNVGPVKIDNCIIKYAYTPTHTTENIYIDQPTYLAMRDAFGCALYNRLNDVERESQKRASLARTAAAILPSYPNDYRIPEDSNVVPEGRVYIRSVFKEFGV